MKILVIQKLILFIIIKTFEISHDNIKRVKVNFQE